MNWRVYVLGGLLAAMFALSMYIAHLQTKARTAEKAADVARAQTVVSEGVASAVDRTIIRERTITEETVNVIREIDALPSGEALVPYDVARIWAGGIDRLRLDAAKPDGDDSREPEGLPR
jgi:hypothetical protein